MRILLFALVFLFANSKYSYSQISAEVQQKADLMVSLCVGSGKTEIFSVSGDAKAGLSIKTILNPAQIGGQINFTSTNVQGLAQGINNALTQVASDQATQVRECLKPVREKILKILFPDERPTNSIDVDRRRRSGLAAKNVIADYRNFRGTDSSNKGWFSHVINSDSGFSCYTYGYSNNAVIGRPASGIIFISFDVNRDVFMTIKPRNTIDINRNVTASLNNVDYDMAATPVYAYLASIKDIRSFQCCKNSEQILKLVYFSNGTEIYEEYYFRGAITLEKKIFKECFENR